MSREEFLTELRKALQGRVSQQTVNDNLRYYEEYILTESHKGKTEAEVIAELGNPRLLAKSKREWMGRKQLPESILLRRLKFESGLY